MEEGDRVTSIFEQKETEPKRATRIRLKSMGDLRKFAGRCLREAYAGDLTATQARAISTLLDTARRLSEASQLEARVKVLEGRAGDVEQVSGEDLEALRGRIEQQKLQHIDAFKAEEAEDNHADTVDPDPDA